ncbi:MAG: OmpA family protein [Nevskiaceae bacterium]|nr:MAG: OmpA family protein [Nevskiaceae bacterium]TBR72035.1 MAG: OmpA family protein [Nevskiaceae bacterium]
MKRSTPHLAVCAGVTLGLLGSTLAYAQGDSTTPPDRRFYIAPSATYTFADGDRNTRNGVGGQLEFGKRVTDYLELSLIGFYNKYPLGSNNRQEFFDTARALGISPINLPTSARVYGGGFGANYFPFSNRAGSLFAPMFVHLDVMAGSNHEQPGVTNDTTSKLKNLSLIADAGLGYDLSLDWLFGKYITGSALRLQGLYRFDHRSRGALRPGSVSLDEAVLMAGLRIPLGAAPVPPPPPPAPAPEPVAVVPVTPPPPPPPCETPVLGQPFSIEGCKPGDSFALTGVNFAFDRSTLEPGATNILDMVSSALGSHKGVDVELDGYTDSIGAKTYNKKLSERRANVVKKYLANHGVEDSRMTAKGFGMANPVADNNTAEGRAKNRRTEVKITKVK